MAQLLPDVKEAGMKAITDQMSYTHEDEAATMNAIRCHFAVMVEAPSEQDIAIVPSTGFAITLAAKNIERQLQEKQVTDGTILVLQDQMCSAVYPWQDLCDRSQGRFTLEIVPYPHQASSWTEEILQRLQAGTRVAVACLPPLHWSDGALIDLVLIGQACRSTNIPLVVDATQAVGAMDLNVQQIQPVLLACSIHKWLRGPAGASLVYIDSSLHDTWSPLDLHGRGRDLGGDAWDAAKDEMGPNGYPEKFFDDARKFDCGGRPSPIVMPMLKVSLDHVVTMDRSALQNQLKSVLQPLVDWVHSNDKFVLPQSHRYHLLGLRPSPTNTMNPDEMVSICKRLQKERGICIAVRCGAFRISPYIDTTRQDVVAFIAAMDDLLHY